MHNLAFVGYDDGAELGLVVVAMFAVLILAGLWLVSTFFAGLFRRIPLIGGPLASGFDLAARGLRAATMGTWHGCLWALGKIGHAMVAFGQNTVGIVRDTLDALGGALEYQANVRLPREISQTRAFATHMANLALTTALQFATSVRNDAFKWAQQNHAYTDTKSAQEHQYTTEAVRQSSTQLLHDIGQLRAEENAALAGLKAQTTAQFTQAEADIKTGDTAAVAQAIKTALADVDAEAKIAIAPLWAGIETELQNLEHVIGQDFPELLRMLQAIPTNAPTDLAAVVGVATMFMRPITRVTADCTIPTCRDLGPLRDLLHLLSEAGWIAALLAWLIFCITDPVAAAADTVTVTDPIIGAVMQPLIDLLGA
jgi:hypothetical protein